MEYIKNSVLTRKRETFPQKRCTKDITKKFNRETTQVLNKHKNMVNLNSHEGNAN